MFAIFWHDIFKGSDIQILSILKFVTVMKTMIYFTIIASAIFLGSCERDFVEVVKGSGPVVSETRHISNYDEVTLSIPANVYIYQGNEETVVVEAQDNVLDVLRTDVDHDELNIRFANHVLVKRHEPIKVFITTRNISQIRIAGSGNVFNETPLIAERLYIKISGSGNVDLHDIDSPVVEAQISGSGKVYLSGYCADQVLNISGSGNIYAFDLMSETADVNISGSGKTEISVSEYLNARISGSGDIYYKGHPSVDSRISGSGRIHSVN